MDDTARVLRPPLRTLFVTAATMLTADVATKSLAVSLVPPGRAVTVADGVLTWGVERNAGAALSIGQGHTWVFTMIAAASVLVLFWCAWRTKSRVSAVGAGLLLGGALGNLADRVFRAPGPLLGHVVDFVSFGAWPVFNAADVGIACGVVILAWRSAVPRRVQPPALDTSPTKTDWSWAG
jgi:signal peptidase II